MLVKAFLLKLASFNLLNVFARLEPATFWQMKRFTTLKLATFWQMNAFVRLKPASFTPVKVFATLKPAGFWVMNAFIGLKPASFMSPDAFAASKRLLALPFTADEKVAGRMAKKNVPFF